MARAKVPDATAEPSNATTVPGGTGFTPAAPPTSPLFALLVVALLALSACSGSVDAPEPAASAPDGEVQTYSGYTVDPPQQVGDVVLPEADGSGRFRMKAQPGGLDLIYFGYTFCPDVCPTTMSGVHNVLEHLDPDQAERIQVAMVTIDPARDTAEVLPEYVANFVEEGVALRTEDPEQLRAAADAFGADYEVTTNDDGEIEVAHTGDLYAVDGAGTVVMVWPFGTSAKSITRDVRSLLEEGGSPT